MTVAGFHERAVAAALIWLRDNMVTPSEASRHGGSGLEEIWKRELGPSLPRFFARRVGGSEVSVFFDRAAPSLFQNAKGFTFIRVSRCFFDYTSPSVS